MPEEAGITILDYTTSGLQEVVRFLEETVCEREALRVLPQLGKTIPLEQIYIPVKVSQRRIRNIAEERAAESKRLDHWK